MKTVIKWGLIIGVPLAVGAYIFLTIQGYQLEAQLVSETTDKRYIQIKENKLNGVQPTNSINMGTVTFNEEDGYTPQPANGYRKFQATLYANDIQGMN